MRLQAVFPAQTTLSIGVVGSEVAIAPDGARIAYVGQGAPSSPPQLFIHTMGGETLPIAGTDQALSPFFSPNGEMVAFLGLKDPPYWIRETKYGTARMLPREVLLRVVAQDRSSSRASQAFAVFQSRMTV